MGTNATLQFALSSWSTWLISKKHIRYRLSRLSPLIILLIFLERWEISIFLPHGHMPSYLTDACNECLTSLAHWRRQCIDLSIMQRAFQMRPCVSPETSEEEMDLWAWRRIGEMMWVISWVTQQAISRSIAPSRHAALTQQLLWAAWSKYVAQHSNNKQKPSRVK